MIPSSHPPSTQAQGLRFYILRRDTMVPLVPVDQIPFALQGVPRQLSHRQMSDEGWKFLCETDDTCTPLTGSPLNASFSPKSVSNSPPRFLAPDHNVRVEPSSIHEGGGLHDRGTGRLPTTANTSYVPPSMNMTSSADPSSLTERFAAIYQKDAQRFGYRSPHPSGLEPDQSKKEYCTHWIKTGECAFMSIGCKYKHEMPALDRLRELGFTRGMPKWYVEKSALIPRGPTWMERRLAHGHDDEDHDREMPAPREFPDPASFAIRSVEEQRLANRLLHSPRRIAKQEMSSPPAPPSTPTPEAGRLPSQISNLLIDLDDLAISPRSSISFVSSVSATSTDNASSSASSPSPSSLPAGLKTAPKASKKVKQHIPASRQLSTKRHAKIMESSDSEEEVKPAEPTRKRNAAMHAASRKAEVQVKPRGLADSRYACTHVQSTDTGSHARTAKRKVLQSKYGEVATLGTQVESSRRSHTTHKKSKAKGEVAETAEKKRAVLATSATIRHTAV